MWVWWGQGDGERKFFLKKNFNLKKKSRDRGRVWRKVEVGGGGGEVGVAGVLFENLLQG